MFNDESLIINCYQERKIFLMNKVNEILNTQKNIQERSRKILNRQTFKHFIEIQSS